MSKPTLRLLQPFNTIYCTICSTNTREAGVRIGDVSEVPEQHLICRLCSRQMIETLKYDVTVNPFIKVKQQEPKQCLVCKEFARGEGLLLPKKDKPEFICGECVKLVWEILQYKVYVYKWERQKK